MTTPSYDTPGPVEPAAGAPVRLAWHEVPRGGRWGEHGWWRLLLGAVLLLVGIFVVQGVVVGIWTAVQMAGGKTYDEVVAITNGDAALTPGFLAVVELAWAATIPFIFLLYFVMHRLRPGWSMSVVGRMRWRWMGVCFGLAAVALVLNVVVSAFLPTGESGTSSELGGLNAWTPTVRDFVLVIVLCTPLQAAGEEFAFRGYLTQVFGVFRRPWIAVLVPALLFAAAHGIGQDFSVFVDRFAFGLVAGFLAIATGGIEAGIALHVLNNLLAFGLAVAFGDITTALEPTSSSYWPIVSTVVQSVSYTALVVWVARRRGIETRTPPIVLPVPSARV